MRHPKVRRSHLNLDRQIVIPVATAVAAALLAGAHLARAQEAAPSVRFADRGPAFYAPLDGRGGRAVRVDAGSVAALRQRIGIALRSVTIPEALAAIGDRSGLRFAYDQSILAAAPRVTLVAQDLTVAAALTQVLLDAGVDVEILPAGLVSLFPRAGAHRRAVSGIGALIGHVTDAKTGQHVPYATIAIEGTDRAATASDSGTYRIAGLQSGAYNVLARALGYAPTRVAVTIVAGLATEVDLALEKSASPLDRVVVTGTVVPMEVKAVPSPVTVITADEIAEQHPRTTVEVFRQLVPSAVAWDDGMNPENTTISMRGASTLNPGSGAVKVYLDGVEISDRDFAAVDPASIDHIEVLRGPEAAAIYGSDAIGGVMQVFTKRGDPSLARPQIDVQAAGGLVQSPYAGYREAPRQEYAAALRGGTPTATYNIGGGYTGTGNWIPEGAASIPSVYGGIHLDQSPITVDLSGRDFVQNTAAGTDPRLAETGFFFFSKPTFRTTQYQEQTLGGRIGFAPTSAWTTSVTAGVDRFALDLHSTVPRFTTPADSFLFLEQDNRSKVSVALTSSVRVGLGSIGGNALSATLTGGADHYDLSDVGFAATNALNVSGTIQSDSSAPAQPTRATVSNTGAFLQAQTDWGDALFVTGAVRADRNSSFGAKLGTPISPRVGVSLVHAFGDVTVKLRGSYGEAIHPPDPDETEIIFFAGTVQLANPNLGPERQLGADAGFDIAFGGTGSIGVTYYNQTALDLISLAQLDPANQIYQYQNVGKVKNTGLELEGTLRVSRVLQLRAQYAYTRSRVLAVGSGYQGDLEVGDQVFGVPWHTAGGTVTVTPGGRTTLTGGVAYVGSWTNDDIFAELRCFAGTGPCPPTSRGFLITYPGFVKINVGVTQQLTRAIAAFVSVNNATNELRPEYVNLTPAMGRVSLIGLRVHY